MSEYQDAISKFSRTLFPTEQNIEKESIDEKDSSEEDTPKDETSNVDIQDEKLNDITISFEVDSVGTDKTTVKVYCKNNSTEIFTGDVAVYFYGSSASDRLGNDMIIVEDLQPGQQSWAVVEIDKYNGTPKMDYEFSDGYIPVTVKNDRGFTLPVTGGIGTTLFSITGIALMAGGLLLIIAYFRKKSN